jgi:hypothetical protein
MVLRSWKVSPEKKVTMLLAGNTPTRMSALTAGHVDGAMTNPDSLIKVLATGCCHVLAELAELPLHYACFRCHGADGAAQKPARHAARPAHGLRRHSSLQNGPQARLLVLEESGIKEPAVAQQKGFHELVFFGDFIEFSQNGFGTSEKKIRENAEESTRWYARLCAD